MKPAIQSLPTLALLLSLTAACANQPSTPSRMVAVLGAPATIRGVVRDEAGAPVPGVRIVAQGRLNDNRAEASAVTGADGSYSLTAPASAYDVGLDLEGSDRFAVNYYGPVSIREGATRDFVMHSAAGMDRSAVFGKISLRPGAPASARLVQLRSANASRRGGMDPTIPQLQSTMTDANGAFSMRLGSDDQLIELDVEMFEADGALDEFVSIATRAKPTYLEFATEEITEEDSTRAGSVSEADRLAAIPMAGEPLETGPQTFRISSSNFNSRLQSDLHFDCTDGYVSRSTHEYGVYYYLPIPGGSALDKMLNAEGYGPNQIGGVGTIYLSKSGKLWYDYRFVIGQRGQSRGHVFLTDRTNDRYRLSLGGAGGATYGTGYAVNYNSDDPTIVRMQFNVDP